MHWYQQMVWDDRRTAPTPGAVEPRVGKGGRPQLYEHAALTGVMFVFDADVL